MFQVGDEVLVVDDSLASVGTIPPFKIGDRVLVKEIRYGTVPIIKVDQIWWLADRFVLAPITPQETKEWWNDDEETQ